MTPAKSEKWRAAFGCESGLLWIFMFALVIRVALMLILRSWEFPDEWRFGWEMGRLGQGLAEGKGFVSTIDRKSPSASFPPVYPLLVGASFSLFGAYSKAAGIVLLLFQSVCAAATAVCLVLIGSRLLDRTTGLIAGFLWALYPTSLFYSVVHIWYSELAVMLVLLAATVVVTAGTPLRFSRIVLFGGLSGLVVLTDPVLGPYLGLLLFWMLLSQRVLPARFAVLVAAWGFTFCVAVSPWVIRNWVVLGAPRLVKSNFGLELFRGNNPFSSGANTSSAIARAQATLDQKELAHYKSQPELVYNRYLQDKAVEWIRADPLRFFHLTIKRVYYFWVWNPHIKNSGRHLTYYGPLAILALGGLWYGLYRRLQLAPVWLFLLVYPLPYYLTHVDHYRYRYPVEPFIVLLAVVPLALWLSKYRAKALGLSPTLVRKDWPGLRV